MICDVCYRLWRTVFAWARALPKAAFALALSLGMGAAVAQEAGDAPPTLTIVADSFRFDSKAERYVAQGGVEVVYGGHTVNAPIVVYDAVREEVTVGGASTIALADAAGVIDAQAAGLELRMGRIIARTIRSVLASGVELDGRSALVYDNGSITAHDAVYSGCARCPQTGRRLWQIRASRVVLDNDSGTLTYSNPVLELWGGMPVFWLPWLQQAAPNISRQTGFLFPNVGNSSSLGTWIEVPVFIAVDHRTNLILKPGLPSDARLVFSAEGLNRAASGDTKFIAHSVLEREQPGGNDTDQLFRWSLSAEGEYRISPVWAWGFGFGAASDSLFASRYGFTERSAISRSLYFRGLQRHTQLRAEVYGGRRLIVSDKSTDFTLALPYVEYVTQLPGPGGHGDIDWRLDLLRLARQDDTAKFRISSRLGWRSSVAMSSGLVISPAAGLRTDYIIDDGVARSDTARPSTFRMQPWVSVGLSLPMAKQRGDYTHIFQPRLKLITVAGGARNDEITNDHSQDLPLNDSNIFRDSLISGFDRVNEGTFLVLAADYTARSARQYFSAFVGRYVKLSADATGFTVADNQDMLSDYVVSGVANFGKTRFNFRALFDEDDFSVRSQEVSASVALARDSSFGVGYGNIDSFHFQGTKREQVRGDVALSLGDGWKVTGSARYDFEQRALINNRFAVSYADDCFFASLRYKSTLYESSVLGRERRISLNVRLGNLLDQTIDVDANSLFDLEQPGV